MESCTYLCIHLDWIWGSFFSAFLSEDYEDELAGRVKMNEPIRDFLLQSFVQEMEVNFDWKWNSKDDSEEY